MAIAQIEEQLRKINEHFKKILTPIFMKEIIKKQKKENNNLKKWL